MQTYQTPEQYTDNALWLAKQRGSAPFNWYYKPYTDALHKVVTNCYIGRVDTGIFDHNGSLYTSGGDLLIYLGEK